MVGHLVMLPVRVGVRVTRLWFRAVEETVSVTTNATGRAIELLASRSSNGAGAEPPGREHAADPSPARHEAPPAAPDLRSSRPTQPPASVTVQAPAPETPAEPVHVSEEPVLVEELAEPGAEEGAGAEVHVDPPWDGYKRMNAKQVVARLAGADPAVLAAVQLYEGTSRRRQTILNAAERELRIANAQRSRNNQQP